MKKYLALFLALLTALFLCACGDSATSGEAEKSGDHQAAEEASSEQAAAADAEASEEGILGVWYCVADKNRTLTFKENGMYDFYDGTEKYGNTAEYTYNAESQQIDLKNDGEYEYSVVVKNGITCLCWQNDYVRETDYEAYLSDVL